MLASFIVILVALLPQVECVIMFWTSYDFLWVIGLGLLAVAVILVLVGITTFNLVVLLLHTVAFAQARLTPRGVRWVWEG